MARGGHADRVAQAQLVAAHVQQGLADLHHLGDGDRALPRVAEAHGEVAADMDVLGLRAAHHRLEHRQCLVHRAVEVGLGEGLRRAGEDRDPPGAQRQGAVQAPLVRDQHRECHREVADEREQLLRVRQLGDPLGVDEARRLDRRQARVGQAADELRLDLRRDRRLLVLQAVARTDLVDADAGGQVPARDGHREPWDCHSAASSCGAMTASTWSMATVVPGATSSSVTLPACGAEMTCSIFIASTTSRL